MEIKSYRKVIKVNNVILDKKMTLTLNCNVMSRIILQFEGMMIDKVEDWRTFTRRLMNPSTYVVEMDVKYKKDVLSAIKKFMDAMDRDLPYSLVNEVPAIVGMPIINGVTQLEDIKNVIEYAGKIKAGCIKFYDNVGTSENIPMESDRALDIYNLVNKGASLSEVRDLAFEIR